MDIERVFMSCYKIEEQPDDIFNLIELALRVGAFKYQPQFEKRKARIIKFLMNPSITSTVMMMMMMMMKKKKKKSTELKKTDLVQQLDKQGTPQSHNSTTMSSRKRMNESTKRVQVAPPRVRLLSDLSFEKNLDRDKQSHKGFKKMESDHHTETKREGAQKTPTQCRRKECTTGSTKSMLPPLMKMNVQVSPLLHPKQSNCSSRTKPMQKTSQSSAVARPMQKETQSDSDMKKKFESSKRKFEQRLADQREAKRRIVLVDFHQMPKAANDPRAPKRCWNRKKS
ncbi:hypothetical protein KY290_001975 [Solanum tuberosum]|uniref:Uncharacterized protein n=1 Tax=Solanum tuberosum TaxID=4113 RepID=A0ABQ7WNQ8_SOLTU|nr:hypothetical protein KY290_001975 [Solanum tuberosum]